MGYWQFTQNVYSNHCQNTGTIPVFRTVYVKKNTLYFKIHAIYFRINSVKEGRVCQNICISHSIRPSVRHVNVKCKNSELGLLTWRSVPNKRYSCRQVQVIAFSILSSCPLSAVCLCCTLHVSSDWEAFIRVAI
jgi:hypothetical protein